MKNILAVSVATALFSVSLFAAGSETLRKAPELSINFPGKGQQLLSQYRGQSGGSRIYFHNLPALPGSF